MFSYHSPGCYPQSPGLFTPGRKPRYSLPGCMSGHTPPYHSGRISQTNHKSSQGHNGVYLGLITSPHKATSRHRSRHALFRSHKYFELYHALTNLYPSRHALIFAKHISYSAPSPGCCPQPTTGHRPQVAASFLAISILPSLDQCRTSTKSHSRCVHGHKSSNELLLGNHTPSCRASTEFDWRYVHGHMLSNKMSSGSHTPSLRRYRKLPINQQIPQIVVSLLSSTDS